MLITDPITKDERPEPPGGHQVAEAYENLRVIREVMERSTKHSTLSGFSGILAGLWAIAGSIVSSYLLRQERAGYVNLVIALAAVWLAVLGLAAATDFLVTKSRAVRVGKQVFSKLGLQMVRAAAPGFAACLLITFFFVAHHEIGEIWPYWMVCYGLAICSVGQFSPREVSWLGWGFLVFGLATLFLPIQFALVALAISFGGLHIVYGLFTGITRRDW